MISYQSARVIVDDFCNTISRGLFTVSKVMSETRLEFYLPSINELEIHYSQISKMITETP